MDIINQLGEQYNISEKQIRILKVLEFKDLTARDISRKTKIPIGRLYDYLNKLLDLKLIDKSRKKPCVFSFKNKQGKIYGFIKSKFKETVEKEAFMLSLLEKSHKEITLLKTKADYIMESRRILSEEKEFFSIERKITVPHYFYPENYEDYLKVREEIKKKREIILEEKSLQKLYKDNYFESIKKRKKFISITHQFAVSNFLKNLKKSLGNEKFKEHMKKLIHLIQSKKIDCRISKEAFPFYMLITNNFVMITFNIPLNFTGLLIRDKNIAKQFIEFFYGLLENSKPALPFLKKQLKILEK